MWVGLGNYALVGGSLSMEEGAESLETYAISNLLSALCLLFKM